MDVSDKVEEGVKYYNIPADTILISLISYAEYAKIAENRENRGISVLSFSAEVIRDNDMVSSANL